MSYTPNLETFRQFAEKHPAFTEGGLRWLRFNEHSNGFSSAFKTVGRRVLIDEAAFFAAIERQNARQEPCRG